MKTNCSPYFIACLVIIINTISGVCQENRVGTVDHQSIMVQADERIFTIFAALNAAGYNDENNPQGMHPVRQIVRERLASKHLKGVNALSRFVHNGAEFGFTQWVLSMYGEPPAFNPIKKKNPFFSWISKQFYFEPDDCLRSFYQEANIESLWKEFRPNYEAEINRYQPLVDDAVKKTLLYLRIEKPQTSQIIVIPNLLESYWTGCGAKSGQTTYIILGPSPEPNIIGVQHEYMHYITDPLTRSHAHVITKAQENKLWKMQKQYPHVVKNYSFWNHILAESVVRAVTVRLADSSRQAQQLDNEEKCGFILVRPLAIKLQEYEDQKKQGFADYIPELLGSLNQL